MPSIDYKTFSDKACEEVKELISNTLVVLNNLPEKPFEVEIIKAFSGSILKINSRVNQTNFALLLSLLSTKNEIRQIFTEHDIKIENINKAHELLQKPEDWNFQKEEEIFNKTFMYSFDEEMLKDLITTYEVFLHESELVREQVANDDWELLDELDEKVINNYRDISADFEEDEKNFDFNKLGYFIEGSKYKEAPAICREAEIKEVVLALLSPEKSVILTGPAGVGKTAIAEQIAYLIANKKIHKRLEDKKIFSLDVASLTAGCKYVGELEKKVTDLVAQLRKNPNIILFIDEIHTIIGAGKSEGSQLDVSNILKGPISRGEIRIIGATTEEEYNKYFEGKVYDPNLPLKDQNRSFGGDKAFKDRFEKVSIPEPDVETMRYIIKHLLDKYSKTYNLPVGLVGAEINALSLFLATFTSSQYRNSQASANPRFISHLLGKAFANSIYDYKDKLSLSDIALSLYKSDLKFELKEKRVLARELIDLVTRCGIEEELKLKK